MPEAPPYAPEDADLRLLLLQWYRRARQAQLSHADAATAYANRAKWLGVPVVVLSALVGTSVFATLTQQAPLWLQILTGMLSVAAAILAAVQTFLRSADVAGEHRSASRDFGALRRQIGQVGAVSRAPRQELLQTIDDIRKRFDEVSAASPNVHPAIIARRQSESRAYFPGEFGLWPEEQRQANRDS